MIKRIVAFLFLLFVIEVHGDAIYTPEFDERNEFAVKSPLGWGYRTLCGKNGLIAVLWPAGTSFNKADTAAFVFVQNLQDELPAEPDNINIFREKCEKADFKFSDNTNDDTKSIAERYFTGRCGRTMILLKEQVGNYVLIIAFVSAKYVSKQQLEDVKGVMRAYKCEVEQYLDEYRLVDLD